MTLALTHEQERQTDCHHRGNHAVYHPTHPRHVDTPISPIRTAQKNPSLDQRRETHGDRPQEETVVRVSDHDSPDCRVEYVTGEGDEEGECEEDGVEDEEDHG